MKNLIDADKLLTFLDYEEKDAAGLRRYAGMEEQNTHPDAYYAGYQAGLQQAMRYVKLAKLDETVTFEKEP